MSDDAVTVTRNRDSLRDDNGLIPSFPPAAIDPATGRIRPLSNEERAARRSAAIRALDAVARITDESDTEELWEEGMRDIDAHRRHRKLFEGMY